jgi:hypothetical protein
MGWIIESLRDLGVSIAEYITQGIYTLIYCILYPIQILFYWIGNTLKLILNTFVAFFTTMWNTFNIMYDYLSNTLTSLFPNVWTTIILIGLTIVFLLRIYYFVKDISILGNKI